MDAADGGDGFCFGVVNWCRRPAARVLLTPVAAVVDRALGLSRLDRLYRHLRHDDRPFSVRALESLGARWDIVGGGLADIPRHGPLIVVANHPYGGLDGLVLDAILRAVRPDVKLLGNSLLARIPELRQSCLFVDPFGRRSRMTANAAVLRRALRWVAAGGALGLFPAGEVAHACGADREPIDSPWNPFIAWLARRTCASVLPVFFGGGNSRAFRIAGYVHPSLRTALLPRELLRQRHAAIPVHVGAVVTPERLRELDGDDRIVTYLRIRTFALGAGAPGRLSVDSRPERCAPIAAAEPPADLQREVEALPPSQVLLQSGPLQVAIARASEIPQTLREIGRLREVAFRQAGEGTSQSRDVDSFDRHYLHLFVWHADRREIVGAYRAGPTDEILPRSGVAGLYTSTLFRYAPRLLEQITPALELGRAFVRPEYQRDYSPLLLLWKGIGAFVAHNPCYRMLFGPVSISNQYQSLSRQILARFLYTTSYRDELAQLVRPRNPPGFLRARTRSQHPLLSTVVRSVTEVGALLAEIERDQKGVPVLLRQYLKLNARLLGFNVDPAFGNALDGLMLVDLLEVDRTILMRYMGAAGTASFLAHHGEGLRRQAS